MDVIHCREAGVNMYEVLVLRRGVFRVTAGGMFIKKLLVLFAFGVSVSITSR